MVQTYISPNAKYETLKSAKFTARFSLDAEDWKSDGFTNMYERRVRDAFPYHSSSIPTGGYEMKMIFPPLPAPFLVEHIINANDTLGSIAQEMTDTCNNP